MRFLSLSCIAPIYVEWQSVTKDVLDNTRMAVSYQLRISSHGISMISPKVGMASSSDGVDRDESDIIWQSARLSLTMCYLTGCTYRVWRIGLPDWHPWESLWKLPFLAHRRVALVVLCWFVANVNLEGDLVGKFDLCRPAGYILVKVSP
jgi:hypothetical protein